MNRELKIPSFAQLIFLCPTGSCQEPLKYLCGKQAPVSFKNLFDFWLMCVVQSTCYLDPVCGSCGENTHVLAVSAPKCKSAVA